MFSPNLVNNVIDFNKLFFVAPRYLAQHVGFLSPFSILSITTQTTKITDCSGCMIHDVITFVFFAGCMLSLNFLNDVMDFNIIVFCAVPWYLACRVIVVVLFPTRQDDEKSDEFFRKERNISSLVASFIVKANNSLEADHNPGPPPKSRRTLVPTTRTRTHCSYLT